MAVDGIRVERIIRSSRRTLALEIGRRGELVVRAPNKLGERHILDFIKKKRNWILQKQESARLRMARATKPEYVDSQIAFLGEKYNLNKSGGNEFGFDGKEFFASGSREQIRQRLFEWYLSKACEIFAQRVSYWSQMSGLKPKLVKLRDAKTRWGSCGANGIINLNWRLIMAPIWIIDYVAVHELAHLAVPNHSKYFWQRVYKIIPEAQCKDARKWLRANGTALVI